MANVVVSNFSIAGISACVPAQIEDNLTYPFFSEQEAVKFVEATGVRFRRTVTKGIVTSDLFLVAADDLIQQLNWDKNDIDILISVSQTFDYDLPATSIILQNKLHLSKSIAAFDVSLGCSGYVYGLYIITSLMSVSNFKKGILLAGDVSSICCNAEDKSTYPLFGDCGTATAICFDEGSKMYFNLGCDGSGYNAIIIPDSGYRNRVNVSSFELQEFGEGIRRSRINLFLDGMEVFSFGISQAPKTVNELKEHFSLNENDIDFYVFHQANLKMNKVIEKKLKINPEKSLYSLYNYGNTSSASIPLTCVVELKNKLHDNKNFNAVFCGFGVGLSWASCFLNLGRVRYLNLLEL